MRRWLLPAALTVTLSGCGLGASISELLETDAAPEIPPLTEFEPSLAVQALWSHSVGEGAEGQYLKLAPAVVGETVFVADRDGETMALDLNSGELRWERDLETPVSGGPGTGEGMVVLGTREGGVVALSEVDGATLWEASVSSEVLALPRVGLGVVVIRTVDGKLYGLDAESGKRLWSYDRQVPVLTVRGTGTPVIVRELVIAGFDNGGLAALELRTGKVAWEAPIAQPKGRTDLERMVDVDADPLVHDGTLYVAGYHGRVAAAYPDSGQILWEEALSSHAGIGVDDEQVYVADDEGGILALDRYSGRRVWRKKFLRGRTPTAPTAGGEYVIVGDIEGYLHWLHRESGELAARVQVDDSPILVAPLSVEDLVIAYSSEGTLSAYRAEVP